MSFSVIPAPMSTVIDGDGRAGLFSFAGCVVVVGVGASAGLLVPALDTDDFLVSLLLSPVPSSSSFPEVGPSALVGRSGIGLDDVGSVFGFLDGSGLGLDELGVFDGLDEGDELVDEGVGLTGCSGSAERDED